MENSLFQQNIISSSGLCKEKIKLILDITAKLKKAPRQDFLKNKVIASCFFEASTRTRLSFEAAIYRLGGAVVGFADASNTSLSKKGETLSDSIRVISSYADAIIIRHPNEGAARLASEVSSVPIINGGDGANQHPTQTLLDLFSIWESQGRLDNLKIAFVGDLKYGRTVHSLAQTLALFNAEFSFLSPEALAIPDSISLYLQEKKCTYHTISTLEEVIHSVVDIIYMTRIQKERFDETEFKHIASRYILKKSILAQAQPHMKILHPLPRIDEIDLGVDATQHAYYFQQAENGIYTRQALLSLLLNKGEIQFK